MDRQPLTPKAARWLELLRLWQQSGLGIRAFCRRHRLNEPCFHAWRRLLRQRGLFTDTPSSATRGRRPLGPTATPTFVKVAVQPTATALGAIDVVLVDQRVLRVRSGFDPDLLRQLLHVLEEPSC
jgi:hypothetical protein